MFLENGVCFVVCQKRMQISRIRRSVNSCYWSLIDYPRGVFACFYSKARVEQREHTRRVCCAQRSVDNAKLWTIQSFGQCKSLDNANLWTMQCIVGIVKRNVSWSHTGQRVTGNEYQPPYAPQGIKSCTPC